MNKGLELIEAHWLFGLPAEKLDAIVHPQSIVHSFVEFIDGSVVAQLAPPDMRLPIQYAITWPNRVEGCAATLAFDELESLEFQQVDPDRFPALRIAKDAIRSGGTAGAIFNAANEAAVESFLAGSIAFSRIAELVEETSSRIKIQPADSLEAILAADQEAREIVRSLSGAVTRF
jgi:1-deoxy-D-xylulose-5-phosphate reductoisomerase